MGCGRGNWEVRLEECLHFGRSGAAFVLAQDGNQLSASILELLVTSELGTCGLAQALVMVVVSTEYLGGGGGSA